MPECADLRRIRCDAELRCVLGFGSCQGVMQSGEIFRG